MGKHARKKWRLKTYPSFSYTNDIEVDEGTGWRLFERAEFPERGGA